MKRTALPVRLVAAFNKVKIKGIAKKILSTIPLSLQSIIGVRRLAAVKRTALPADGLFVKGRFILRYFRLCLSAFVLPA